MNTIKFAAMFLTSQTDSLFTYFYYSERTLSSPAKLIWMPMLHTRKPQ
jgi:hypothetical protein